MKNSKFMNFRKSIFTKLVISFILYMVIVFTTIVVGLVLEAVFLSKGQLDFDPAVLIDEYGNIVRLETMENIGGWVEELDENYHVVKTYGEKKTADDSYTNEELLNITSTISNTEYIGFYFTPEKTDRRFLALYDRDVMNMNRTIIINKVDNREAAWIFRLCAALVIIETICISLYLRRKIKRPLDDIINGMERIQAGEDETRLEIKTEAEFKKIVQSFNEMAKKLEQEKREKEFITKQKNQTLLELSHDIKTPVATIKSYANALKDDLVTQERKEECYCVIDRKADRVGKLVDDMFTMLKMDNAEYELFLEETDLSELVRRLAAESYDEVINAGYEYDINITEECIITSVDISLFSRVFTNLLSNAMKYNTVGNKISVSLTRHESSILLKVSDDGAPIDESFIEEIFQPFSRGDRARQTDGGTGLGLAISKLIVEKHGGNITYRRENEMNVFNVMLS